MLATIPFLILFLYLLYLAYIRPSLAIYQNNNNQAWQETGAIIPLMDMMGCFLAFLGLFSMLTVYIAIFVKKRRALMKSYLDSGKTVLGDVFYENNSSSWKCGSFSKYAFAMYAHPDQPKQWLVRKRVRCFQHYTRERVTILLLPQYPYSGQPKSDVEMDLMASEQSSSETNKILCCLYAWIIFLIAAPIYLLHQMSLIEDDYDDPQRGWKIYLICVLAVIPIVCFGGNYLRWRLHRHWVVNRGTVIHLEKPTSGDVNAQVVDQNDCNIMACMGYDAMDDETEMNSMASPTNTVGSKSTAYNSVYMA